MGPLSEDRAERVARIVGCDASDVQDQLRRWAGEPLSRRSDQQIANSITRLWDQFAREAEGS